MRRYHHLVEGVVLPDELDSLQTIFDVIISQPWFDLNDQNRESFASELIALYRGGIVDFSRLHRVAAVMAIASFGRELTEEGRQALMKLYSGESNQTEGQTGGEEPSA